MAHAIIIHALTSTACDATCFPDLAKRSHLVFGVLGVSCLKLWSPSQ